MTDWGRLTPTGRRRRYRALAVAALERFPIQAAHLRLIGDDTNIVYRVDGSGGSWILRIGHAGAIEHAPAQVRSETAVLHHLSGLGLGVPKPVAGRDGDDLQRVTVPGVPHTRSCVLFERLAGRMIGERIGTATAVRYGRLAADLHAGLRSFRPPTGFRVVSYDRPFPFEEEVTLFEGPRSLLDDRRRRLFRDLEARVAAGIAELRRVGPPQLVHGDLHVWNVLVTGDRMAAIDFEDLMWGWTAQDLATTLYYLDHRPDFPALLDAFRAGYEQISPWPDDNLVALFVAGRSLVLANDVTLLQDDPSIDVPAFFERAERRIARWLG